MHKSAIKHCVLAALVSLTVLTTAAQSIPPELYNALAWRLIELWPRLTIDNSGQWPARVAAPTGPAVRHPDLLLRDGLVTVHESVDALPGAQSVRRVATITTC